MPAEDYEVVCADNPSTDEPVAFVKDALRAGLDSIHPIRAVYGGKPLPPLR